jgi:hypothetical protein
MIFRKLKAGALQFTTFIVVVIALLLTAFIILINTHYLFKLQTNFLLEAIENSNQGINYVLNNNIKLNDSILIDLQSEDYKTLQVHRDFWGVFEKVTSVSKIKNKTFKKVALVGATQPELDRTALYVEDNNRPLVVVGNTKIEGVTYLPKQGVRTGNISGHSYYGNQLIYGKEKVSDKLPTLEVLKQIEAITELYKWLDSNQFLELELNKSYQNSFYSPLQVLFSPNAIYLTEVSITGHIIVQSKTKIIVDASSNLKDIILIAPKIEFRSHVKGTFQAFASQEIIVGTNCKFNYPSALVLKEKEQLFSTTTNKQPPSILVNKQSTIKGILIYLGDSVSYKAQVIIADNTTITGEVYCNKNLELLGRIQGSVYTSGFVANQSGSVYQNHIYNGTITVHSLPYEYIGLTFKNSKKGVAKWLY